MKLETSPASDSELPTTVERRSPFEEVADRELRATLRTTASGPSSPLEKWLLRAVLTACGNPPVRIVLWDGYDVCQSIEPPVGTVHICDRSTLRRLALNPNVAFGDGYAEGRLEVDGPLVEVLCAISRAQFHTSPRGLIGRLLGRRHRSRRSHSIAASRESVHHHYDLGNEFYKLWLDRQLSYTCAYYAQPAFSIEQAQIAKMDHVCRKLRLKPGDRVVEAGCGWGALALHMAERYGAKVRAFNLSKEQVRYAREWAQARGMAGRVEFVEDDYRTITGEYDAFVSVGMLEHVGLENFPALGAVIDGCLTPVGRGLIHTIGRNAPQPLDPWTDKRIFPGAYPPALSEMMHIFEPWRLSVLDVENLRLHYARTLEHWLERYERVLERVREMFDERFVRIWRMYLAGSIAAFRVGSLQLFQVVFAREANNDVPWTRTDLYAPASDG